MENIQTGLLLMVVGMTTVFIILLIVIYMGKGLIAMVNKYAPEEIVVKKQAPVRVSAPVSVPVAAMATDNLSNADAAAIISAVSVVTGGKGKVTEIKKI